MIIYILLKLRRVSPKKCVGVLIILCLSIWRSVPDNKLKDSITFLDVGQGDAALIQLSLGEQILIDSGPGIEILYELSSIMPKFDRHIEYVFLSHQHSDHIDGLNYLRDTYTVGKILLSCFGSENSWNEMGLFGDNIVGFNRFYELNGENFSLKLLWPSSDFCTNQANDENAVSQILLVKLKGIQYLFTGDAEITPEIDAYLRNYIHDIDVIKVPHHGSKDALSIEFLKYSKPEYAVISVGENSYGHPNVEMIRMLNDNNITVFRTDIDGTIISNVEERLYFSTQ